MTTLLKGAAKRLTFSLIAVSALAALSGCAVYGPAPGGPYAYYGSDANGEPVSTTPYYAPYYTPDYSLGYIGPPVSLNFGFGYWGGGGGRYGGSNYRRQYGGRYGGRYGGHR